MKSKRFSDSVALALYGTIAGLLIGISALAIYLVQDRLQAPAKVGSSQFNVEAELAFDGAIRIEPPIELPDFTLRDQHGRKRSLRDLRPSAILLTFGFTNCPDICPLTLSDFQQVRALLGENAQRVTFVFVSVDGRRDSSSVLRRYFEIRKLDDIIALTGSEDSVREIGAPLGLAFEASGDVSAGNYTVNHSAGSFLLDAGGRWIMRFQFGLPPERIAAEILELLP